MKRHPWLAAATLLLAGCGSSSSPQMPAAARADIELGTQTITLFSGSNRLLIEREPLRLRLLDAQDRIVLEQVAPATTLPLPIAALVEPPPLGGELPATPSLYAPFAFIVGVQNVAQFPAGPWEGNVLTATTAGIAYQATAVREATIENATLRLVLTTNDPGGRVLEARIAPAADGAVRVQVTPVPATGVAAMSDAFVTAAGEPFRGFGGRHNALDQRGEDFLGWIQQQNLGVGYASPLIGVLPLTGGDRYLFPNGKTAAYAIAPSLVTPRYGFLLERDELSRWRMASDRDDAWQVQVQGAALDYRLFVGAPAVTLPAMSSVTGRHRAPPDWVTGVLLDRSTIAFTQTPEQYAQQVRADLARIDADQLTVSGYRIEGWFELAPALRAELIGEFKRRGIRVLSYFRPFVSRDGAGTESPATYDEALVQGYVTRNGLGLPYIFLGNFFGLSALIDYTHPPAVAWWKGRIKAALDEGADGFMQDFGEQVLGDMVFADGRRGDVLHNRYPAIYHRLTREAIDEWRLSHPGSEDIWFFTRAGFAGVDGTTIYEGGNFAGDGNTDFSRASGLASQTPDMLNRGINGGWGFTTDIGGYFDFVSPPTTKELFIRWAQWAVLSPVMRVHGSVNAGTHMPWTYDAETLQIWKDLTVLRLRAQPLIQRLWREAASTGMPIARPLWLVYPDDPQAAQQDQQWMLGPDVLVAPVVTEGAAAREVYFPAGCWHRPQSGESFKGPGMQRIDAPLATLPYYFRCDTQPF